MEGILKNYYHEFSNHFKITGFKIDSLDEETFNPNEPYIYNLHCIQRYLNFTYEQWKKIKNHLPQNELISLQMKVLSFSKPFTDGPTSFPRKT